MPSSPSAAADTVARPYRPIGLIVSLAVILALAALFAVILSASILAVLAAARGPQDTLSLVRQSLAGSATHSPSSEGFDVVLGLVAYIAQSLAVVAVARFRGKRDWTALLAWRDWQPLRYWKLFALLFALTVGWEIGASMVIEHIHPAAKDWVVPPKELPWIVGFIALAVLFGPIGEELLFRGWIYTSLRASFGVRAAVLVTSVLFALAHWESTHLYALAVFPVGLALALVRERTGSIAGSITFHALYNGVATVLLFLGR